MKRKFIYFLVILIVNLFIQDICAQVLVGDFNNDGELNVSDISNMVNTLLGKSEKQFIEKGDLSNPYLQNNKLLEGAWKTTSGDEIKFGDDGIVSVGENSYSYKFLPYQGYLIIRDENADYVQIYNVIDRDDKYIILNKLGEKGFDIYYYTSCQYALSIKFAESALSLNQGETYQLVLVREPIEATIPASIEWKSSDEAIAKVDCLGVITAVSPGETTIYASITTKDSVLYAECLLTVNSINIDSIKGDTIANDTIANDTIANDTIANDTIANDTITSDTIANDTIANDTIANDTLIVDTGNCEVFKVLDIGNSYTEDAIAYLKYIVEASGIDVSNMCLYKTYRGGATFKNWYDCYNDNDKYEYLVDKVLGGYTSSISIGLGQENDGSLFRDALNNEKWNVIVIHQSSQYSTDFSIWETESYGGYLPQLMNIIKERQPQAEIWLSSIHSYDSSYSLNTEQSSLERWKKIIEANKLMMDKYHIEKIIPYGTAIQNLRSTSLNTEHDLTRDGTHLGYGLARYTASCAYYQALFYPLYGVSILGNTARPKLYEYEKMTLFSESNIELTDENALIAQQAAILACENWDLCQSPNKHSTADGGEAGGGDGDSTADDGEVGEGDGDSTADDGEAGGGDGDSTADGGEAGGGDGDSTADGGEASGGDGDSTADGGEAGEGDGDSTADDGEVGEGDGDSTADDGEVGEGDGDSTADGGEVGGGDGDSTADGGEAGGGDGDSTTDGGETGDNTNKEKENSSV